MANVIRPQGLQPVKSITGAPYNGQGNMYWIPQADTSQYSIGDLVQTIANSDTNGVPGVSKCATSATRIRGVVVGVYVVPPNGLPTLQGTTLPLEVVNIPATKLKDYYVLVVDDPSILFAVQDDGTTTLGQTAANKNINFTVVNGAPYSATVLTNASVAVTQALPLRIVGLLQSQANNTLATPYATWLVKINQHDLEGNTVGI